MHVEGLDDVMVRLSRCCTPVPGDEIMGFVTRGRGVSVHRTDCANAVEPASTRPTGSSRSSGTTTQPGTFVVSVEVEALDRSRLLRDVADVLAEHHVNILSCTSQTPDRPDREAALRVRARRPRPPRLDPLGGQAGRQRLRRVPGAPRPRQGLRELASTRMTEGELAPEEVRRVTELFERVVADPSILEEVPEHERIRFVNAAGDVFSPDVDERRRRIEGAPAPCSGRETLAARRGACSASTGIRRLRAKPVFTTPNVFPPEGFAPDDRRRRRSTTTPLPRRRATRSTATCARSKFTESTTSTTSSARRAPSSTTPSAPRSADLRGRVALLTGGRVKIGYQAGIKLLRAGAELIVTTRFPRDAALRYAREPDFDEWGDRLEVFGLDLRHTPSVEAFCHHLARRATGSTSSSTTPARPCGGRPSSTST